MRFFLFENAFIVLAVVFVNSFEGKVADIIVGTGDDLDEQLFVRVSGNPTLYFLVTGDFVGIFLVVGHASVPRLFPICR